jgi:penicillin-binding protein 2
MLIFDQLKKDDLPLRTIAVAVLACMLLLVGGLWKVQIVSAKKHETDLRNQSYRSVRVPGVRGKIFDRNGYVLAENGPRYDINLYLEELPPYFLYEYRNTVKPAFVAANPAVRLNGSVIAKLEAEARYRVASNLLFQVSTVLEAPMILDPERFHRHYRSQLSVPFPLISDLTRKQVARFVELAANLPGVELETQAVRTYPNGSTACHLLGYVQRTEKFADEDINYRYYLTDFYGRTGIERWLDDSLRGKPGTKSLLVNHLGYRQSEEMVQLPEPGHDAHLTIDLPLQIATEKALSEAMPNVRGAAVVVDVRNGDVLSMVSLPGFDPALYVHGMSHEQYAVLLDPKQTPMLNRAAYGAYHPGSILKILTSLAILENGTDPNEKHVVEPDPQRPSKGAIYVGKRKIKDTAAPGPDYDFEKAFIKSSNSYFIHYGLLAGFQRLIDVGRRFHLGELTEIMPGQETAGIYPSLDDQKKWNTGQLANLCIGQEVDVTVIQMAMMTAAIANGGKVFYPRLVTETRSGDALKLDSDSVEYEPRVRSDARINPAHLRLIHRAMLADVENTKSDDDGEGTGWRARISGFPIGGKTGTAERDSVGGGRDYFTWFASFAPVDRPRYAVVVLVVSGSSGGGTCAPVAKKIYEALIKRETGSNLATSGPTSGPGAVPSP